LALAALLAVGWAVPAPKNQINHQEIVDFVNNKEGSTWKAKVYPRFANMDKDQLKKLMGAKKRHENPRKHLFKMQPKFSGKLEDIPDSFDARDNWPACKDVIGIIPDQSACGSCWAVSSASVMGDRECIGSNGQKTTPLSANDLISCCFDCGFGCQGGWPDEAFYSWTSDGVVSGSGYSVDSGCQPYPFPECEHHINKTTYGKCPSDLYDTPNCKQSCQTSYKDNTYTADKRMGKSAVYFSQDNSAVQQEIMTNGPVVFTFDVYADFPSYTSGVYQHLTGDYLGGHAVRAIGWGVENGTPYWLIANSWNPDWGMNGYFKMIRGTDNCGIEDEVSAALFKG